MNKELFCRVFTGLGALVVTGVACAQSGGCEISPENPTVVLALLGAVSGVSHGCVPSGSRVGARQPNQAIGKPDQVERAGRRFSGASVPDVAPHRLTRRLVAVCGGTGAGRREKHGREKHDWHVG